MGRLLRRDGGRFLSFSGMKNRTELSSLEESDRTKIMHCLLPSGKFLI